MITRRLGRTNLSVSPLALGTVELGMNYGIRAPGHYGRPSEAEAIQLVHTALDAGINLIDTARAYGESEAVLGKALRHRRQQVVLATKLSTRLPDGTKPDGAALRDLMLAQLETSLQQLQTDHVDLWQLHNVDENELSKRETIASVFAEVKQSGKVRFVGGSFYGSALPVAALAYDLFDTIQVTYSIFDQRMTAQVFPLAAQKDVGVIVRSVLLQGALTERADHLPDHLEPLRARSRQFRQWVATSGLALQPAQVALAFALANPALGAVLVGVRSQTELEEDLVALHTPLSATALDQLAQFRIDDETLLNPGTWKIQ